MTLFSCSECSTSYTSRKSLRQHERDKHGAQGCCSHEGCSYTYPKSRPGHLASHLRKSHAATALYSPKSSWEVERPIPKLKSVVQKVAQDDEGSIPEDFDPLYGFEDMMSPERVEVLDPGLFSLPEVPEPSSTGEPSIASSAVSMTTEASVPPPPPSSSAATQPVGPSSSSVLDPASSQRKVIAVDLLRTGMMPLIPPAMRNWVDVPEESIPLIEGLRWPPKGWKRSSPDARLILQEMAALSLHKHFYGSVDVKKNALLETFNFLALPDSSDTQIIDRPKIRFLRFYNYQALKDVAATGEDPEDLVTMFTSAASSRDRTLDPLLQKLRQIPLWI